MKNQIVKKKRFQLAFASLPKEYHYYVKETNELTICRDCKRWHFEIAGANITYQKSRNKKGDNLCVGQYPELLHGCSERRSRQRNPYCHRTVCLCTL